MAGSDKIEAVSFRLNEDFKIKFGSEEKEVLVKRLSFKYSNQVIEKIAQAVANDVSKVIEVIGMEMERKTSKDPKQYKQHSMLLQTVITQLLTHKNFNLVSELLVLLSEKTITPEIIDTLQYSEALSIVSFLIDRNFEPLKNFDASLQAIGLYQK